jgi:hypothetical protein
MRRLDAERYKLPEIAGPSDLPPDEPGRARTAPRKLHVFARAKDSILPIKCLIDTGATYSVISRQYAMSLGYRIEECAPIYFTVGDGSRHGSHEQVRIWMKLTEDTPDFREIRFHILGNDLIAIVGMPDLTGYSVAIGEEPKLVRRG